MVELDAESVRLVGRRQRQGHWWILLVTEIEENDVIADLASAERQNELGSEFSDDRRRLQPVSKNHGKEYRTNPLPY